MVDEQAREILVKALLMGIGSGYTSEDLLYASLLNKFPVEVSDEVPLAACHVDNNLSIKILINLKSFMAEYGHLEKDKQIMLLRAIIKHELMHIVAGHMLVFNKRIKVEGYKFESDKDVVLDFSDPLVVFLFNLAADSIINNSIWDFRFADAKFISPEEFITTVLTGQPVENAFIGSTKMELEVLTAESLTAYLYRYLEQSGQLEEFRLKLMLYNFELIGDFYKWLKRLPEHVRQTVSNMIKQVIEQVQQEAEKIIGFGSIKASFVLRPQEARIDWGGILERVVASMSGSEKLHANKHRFNRRYNMAPKIERKGTPKVTVLMDTSGSVEEKDLQAFASEIKRLSKYAYVNVFTYTSELGHEVYIRSDEYLIHYRGGTDLGTAIRQASELIEKSDLLVIFTDGYDKFPTTISKFRCTKIFVLTKDHDKDFEKQARTFADVLILT
ncbi:VWA-like domain-containing protein [Fervidobacterium islandicum]|uniref:VWA-like domain-containing protein n=1 Tax=Fervidobacterium islandicum TaxID=2423 RepID=UPI003A60C1F6